MAKGEGLQGAIAKPLARARRRGTPLPASIFIVEKYLMKQVRTGCPYPKNPSGGHAAYTVSAHVRPVMT